MEPIEVKNGGSTLALDNSWAVRSDEASFLAAHGAYRDPETGQIRELPGWRIARYGAPKGSLDGESTGAREGCYHKAIFPTDRQHRAAVAARIEAVQQRLWTLRHAELTRRQRELARQMGLPEGGWHVDA